MKNVLRRDETRMDQAAAAVDDLYSDALPPTLITPLPNKAKTEETAVPTSRRLWALFERMRNPEHDPYRYLLMLRFVLLNLAAFALLGVAYVHGFVDMVVAADRTYLSVVIGLVFLVGLGLCGRKIWQTSRELNRARQPDAFARSNVVRDLERLRTRDPESRGNLIGAARLTLSHRISIVRHIANSLVLLGLIGTVLGFIIALSGVDAERATDIDAITPMISTLISGMSTALYTTLVGAILNVWLMANHQLLTGGTVKLIASLIESAEMHARD
ncbi:MAG: MotA/TolQ/ExbB proton channel family protein [Acidiferrobacterales bacterium]